MGRLYDRLRRAGIRPFVRGEPVVVEATNVMDYFWSVADDDWSLADDVPNIAPPFPAFFVEYRLPHDYCREFDIPPGVTVGFACMGTEPYGEEGFEAGWETRDERAAEMFDYVAETERRFGFRVEEAIHEEPEAYGGRRLHVVREAIQTRLMAEAFAGGDRDRAWRLWSLRHGGLRFHLEARMYADGAGRRAAGPLHLWHFSIRPDGSLPRDERGRAVFRHGSVWDAEDPDDMRGAVYPALLAVSFMHCKNVGLVGREPPRKLSRKSEKKHGHPLTRYYTLEIEPMKEVLRREGGAEKTGLKRALHICRGHFATYSPEKPLFGRYSGTFWKPQHVRGSRKRGEVVKDYAVKGPRTDG